MNCIPSGKLIINKNKNKSPSVATQKYEQRIKAAKNKQGVETILKNGNLGNDIHNEYMENWLKKRSDIDNWRRDVISAMQSGMDDEMSSMNTNDSMLQPDSSTLTNASTMLSVGELYRKHSKNGAMLPSNSTQSKLMKTSSIPVFQSSPIDQRYFPKFDHQIKRNQSLDNDLTAADDDDDVFLPCTSDNHFTRSKNYPVSNPTIKKSSSYFIEYTPNYSYLYPNAISKSDNHKPPKHQLYFSDLKQNNNVENHLEKNESSQISCDKFIPQQYNPNLVSLTISSNKKKIEIKSNDCPNPNIKKNLYKNEVSAKIILRNSNTCQKTEILQRQGSLSIKRANINQDFRIQNSSDNLLNRTNTNIQSTYYSNAIPTRYFHDRNEDIRYPTNNVKANKNQWRIVPLTPSESQEIICFPVYSSGQYKESNNKNNSLINLRDQKDYTPKLKITNSQSMKSTFASEPNLVNFFQNKIPVKIPL